MNDDVEEINEDSLSETETDNDVSGSGSDEEENDSDDDTEGTESTDFLYCMPFNV